ncbi:uncharacterized protein LOC131950913 [Physella acuta]|uniref:uncharacterized protein LOC131950913 n=1 Tax=Physella acuta TaxID=109671 RepID=UPI0027DB37B2|nr:uncharacterized protein LOC131950913 [Physella acuta]XP_059169106.1 uncharacterized protein LOC131950913 [Physella acuta]XP_059169107.1 uncharacterized protein LOC131950913 [Physella acuta]XP_059169108.1 uncharacterized protein LOC131950913 [Physella acuta]
MNIIGAKVFAGFLFFILTLFFGWTPFWCFKRCARIKGSHQRRVPVLDYLHSLASGVFIATCFLNLLPESLATVRDTLVSKSCKHNEGLNSTRLPTEGVEEVKDAYPLAELLVVFGFLFIYMTDTVIKSWKRTRRRTVQVAIEEEPNDDEVVFQQRDADKYDEGNRSPRWMKPKFTAFPNAPGATATTSIQRSETTNFDENTAGGSTERSSDTEAFISKEVHDLSEKKSPLTSSGQLRSMALVAALCIHGFFDGVMLGLQTSEKVIMSLIFALSLHKTFVSISLSLTLLSNYDKQTKLSRILLYVFLFAVVAPAGLAMSAAFVHTAFDLSERTGQASMIPGCLQAFAVGTFMYVAFTETTERHSKKTAQAEICNHVVLLVGFASMAGLRGFLGAE